MYKIAVYDDQSKIAKENVSLIRKILCGNNFKEGIDFTIEVLFTTIELTTCMVQNQFDLLFLSIDINGEKGIELVKTLRKKQNPCGFIFITANDKYMYDVFDIQLLQYILKLVDINRPASVLYIHIEKYRQPQVLQLTHGTQKLKIPFEHIYYLESMNKKTHIYTKDMYLQWPESLSAIETQLPPSLFCRCHRCYIVNLEHALSIRHNTVQLDNHSELPIGKTRYNVFSDAFSQYIGN